jgi:hypothetical protein
MPASRTKTPTVGLALRGLAARFHLGQNFPNPARLETFIPLGVTKKGPVALSVYGMDGRLVKTLVSGIMLPGSYLFRWDGRDSQGRLMGPGVYGYTLTSSEGVVRKRLVWGR